MSGNRDIFSTYIPSSHVLSVTIADGTSVLILGHGTMRIFSTLILIDILYAPKYYLNLLSIGCLIKSLNCSVTFYPSHCLFRDLNTRKTIGGSVKIDGVYLLILHLLLVRCCHLPFHLINGTVVLIIHLQKSGRILIFSLGLRIVLNVKLAS